MNAPGLMLAVSVHDVAPATAEPVAQWCADLASLGVPVSLLVIAGPWRGLSLRSAPDYARVLRAHVVRGNEVVLHGWTHSGGRAPLHRPEFAALTQEQARKRLTVALGALAGLPVEGLAPPAWAASAGTLAAAPGLGLRYLATRRGLRQLDDGQLRPGLAIGGGRAGLFAADVTALAATTAGRLTTTAGRLTTARGGLVRVALYPDDLRHPGRRDATLRWLERTLRAGARPVTYGQLARSQS